MTLELSGVSIGYDAFELGPIDLTLERGVTTVIGPSGSGKSTLLQVIAGFERPDSGEIALDGRRIDDRPPEERDVGVVFQDYALFPHLSVRENLEFGAASTVSIEDTAAMLDIDGLLDRSPRTLSGGEKQRVALARALVADPSALLLDEPLASLDAPIRRRLRFELRDVLGDLSVPVVYVTHDQDEASIVGDRVAILDDGRVVQAGTFESVTADPATAFVAEFLGMENVLEGRVVDRRPEGATVDLGPVELRASGGAPDDAVAVAFHPNDVRLHRDSSAAGENGLECEVERVVSHRAGGTVALQCPGLGRVTAAVPAGESDGLERGDRRIVAVDPADVRVTARREGR
ncbi:MAG: ABC transporter ATP-binding protein [Halanaeroarchaeum sp.]